jgi:hypothetical protein
MAQKKLQNDSEYNQFDLDGDGIVTDDEMAQAEKMHEIARLDAAEKAAERKQAAQRRMATVSLVAMLLFTVAVMIPGLIPESRIKLLGDISGLFYIAMAGIVGAYMGMTAYMSRK